MDFILLTLENHHLKRFHFERVSDKFTLERWKSAGLFLRSVPLKETGTDFQDEEK